MEKLDTEVEMVEVKLRNRVGRNHELMGSAEEHRDAAIKRSLNSKLKILEAFL